MPQSMEDICVFIGEDHTRSGYFIQGLVDKSFMWDNGGMKSSEIELNRELMQAFAAKDLDFLKSALDRGADPDSSASVFKVNLRGTPTPAAYAIEKGLPVAFLSTLLDAGASLGNVDIPKSTGQSYRYKRPSLLQVATLANNAAAFRCIVGHSKFTSLSPDGKEWALIERTRKPALWFDMFEERFGKPPLEMERYLAGVALFRADTKLFPKLFQDPNITLFDLLELRDVQKGCVNPEGFKMLLDRFFPAQPDAFEIFETRHGNTFLANFLDENKVRASALDALMKDDRIKRDLNSVEHHGKLMHACMLAPKVPLLLGLVKHGLTLPRVMDNETQLDYVSRIGYRGKTKVDGSQECQQKHAEALRDIWQEAQAQTMRIQNQDVALSSRPKNRL